MEQLIISSLAELGATALPDNSLALLDATQEKVLADIISACNIARLRTTDVCDNIYTFLITGDDPFDQSWDGEIRHFGVEDNIWKVTFCESKDRNNIMRMMRITSVSNKFLWGETSLCLCDKLTFDNDNDSSTNKICISGLLLTQIYHKIMAILATQKTLKAYNDSISSILPDYKLTYYVKRADLKAPFAKVHHNIDLETIVKIKTILKDNMSHDEDEFHQVTHTITPRQYVAAWCIAHKSSYSQLLEDIISQDVPFSENIPDDEYFRRHNSKGSELINMLVSGGWDDPSVLKKWGDAYSPYHCYDVIYARTNLQPYGAKLYYTNSVRYYIDIFLKSILSLYASIKDILYISDASAYMDILDDKDYIRLVPYYADKYLRNYKIAEGPCYIEYDYNSQMLHDDILNCKSLIKVNEYCPPIVSDREFIIKTIYES